jgi:glyoxylase-like metal-dependent hydrolase (beta-lactamase superfamily II)
MQGLAKVKILIEGYTNVDSVKSGKEVICPTITLVRDEKIIMVVDPGVLISQQTLVNRLSEEGISISDVNFICVTHSHLDHYRNIGMFPEAKVLDYFGVWSGNVIEKWNEQFTKNIKILKTPGHSDTCITLLVKTNEGTIAICGDVFWREDSPKNDTYANSPVKLMYSRKLVLNSADFIITGHGAMYKVEKIKSIFTNKYALKPVYNLIGRIKEKIKLKIKEKINGNKLGYCKKCKKLFLKNEDRCECQNFFCFRCCECEAVCELCNCKHKIKGR